MPVICTAMFGNTAEFCIDCARLVPMLTSVWICLVASRKTALPEAGPTESSASTSGTPAAKVVASVRDQRATEAFISSSPITGIFSIVRSTRRWTLGERFHAWYMK